MGHLAIFFFKYTMQKGNSCSNNCHSVTTIIKIQSLITSPECHVLFLTESHVLFQNLSHVCELTSPIVPYFGMSTWFTHLSYADLDHPDLFTCLLFDLHCIPTWITDTSITLICDIYLCSLRSPRPLYILTFIRPMLTKLCALLVDISYCPDRV